jgi:hypothetical protein
VKTIALTGHPVAQDAAALQLQALINCRNLPITVRIGLTTGVEAYDVHEAGGEVWHCGPESSPLDLAGLVDRALPATSFDAQSVQIQSCLTQFLSKTNITGEARHG